MHSKSNLASTSRSTNTPSSLQRAEQSELEELSEKQWRLRCSTRKAFAKQQSEAVFAGALGKYVLAKCIQVDRHVNQCKDRCHSEVHDGVRHAKLPHIDVKNHEDNLHLGGSWSGGPQHEPCI